MNLLLAPGILEAILAHAKGCYPNEGCGLVTETAGAPGGRFIPMRNAAASTTEFEMDPQELIGALRDARNRGEQLIAIYHSHPNGPARPSRHDVERAYYPEAAYLIVSLADRERPQAAAFRIIDGEVIEVEVHAIV